MASTDRRPDAAGGTPLLTGGAAWWALTPLLLGSFVGTLSNAVVNVPMKEILAGLRVPLSHGALVVISFNVTFATLMPVTGWAGDRFGRRRVFCLALITLATGAAGASFAPNLGVLVAWRVVEGAGTAAVLPSVMALTSQLFGHGRRGRALGLWSAANGLGQAVAPLLGGALSTWVSWRAIFWPTIPLAALAVVAALRYVPRQPPVRTAIEWRGATSLTVGAALLLSAAALVPVVGVGSWVVEVTAGVGLVGLVLFARASRRAPQPFMSPALLREPSYVRSSLAVMAQMFCFATILLAVPLYLSGVGGISSVRIGLLLFTLPATMTVLAPISGIFTERFGPRHMIRVGMAVIGVAVVLLAMLLGSPEHGQARLVAILVVAGCGVALVQTPAATGATRSAAGQAGSGVGLFNLLRFAGSALGACWVSVVLSSGGSYLTLFGGCTVVVTAGFLGTWAGPRTVRAPAPVR